MYRGYFKRVNGMYKRYLKGVKVCTESILKGVNGGYKDSGLSTM